METASTTSGNQNAKQFEKTYTHTNTAVQQHVFTDTDNFNLVSKQAMMGIYETKRVVNYLTKIQHIAEVVAKEIERHAAVENIKIVESKGDRGDCMKSTLDAWVGVQNYYMTLGNCYDEFATGLLFAVVNPLQAFHREASQRFKDIMEEENKMSKRMKEVRHQTLKSKVAALKAIEQLTYRKQEKMKEAGAPGKKTGFFKKMADLVSEKMMTDEELREKAVALARAYEQQIALANRSFATYKTVELPRVFAEFERLERARLDVFRDHMIQYTALYVKFVQPMANMSDVLHKNILAMNRQKDVLDFITKRYCDLHITEDPFSYQLPVSMTEVREGRCEPNPNANAIFRKSLDEVMAMQRATHPELQCPAILVELANQVLLLRGVDEQGIFRISGNKDDLILLRNQIENDPPSYVCAAGQDAHVPAGVLKWWLRELPEALIPEVLYERSLVIGKDLRCTPQQVQGIFKELAPVVQAIATALASLLAKIVANEEHNKMSTANLSIVFAPSFLRCLSEDPMLQLSNSKHEIRFVKLLLALLIEQASNGAVPAAPSFSPDSTGYVAPSTTSTTTASSTTAASTTAASTTASSSTTATTSARVCAPPLVDDEAPAFLSKPSTAPQSLPPTPASSSSAAAASKAPAVVVDASVLDAEDMFADLDIDTGYVAPPPPATTTIATSAAASVRDDYSDEGTSQSDE